MKMKHLPDMRALLERYWDGETTLEEERRLKAFFAAADEDLPEEFRQEARWFRALQTEKSVEVLSDFRVALRPRRIWWYGIAAAVLVLLGAIGFWWQINQPKPAQQIVQKPVVEKIVSQIQANQPAVSLIGETPKLVQTPVEEPRVNNPVRIKKRSAAPPEDGACEDPEQALAEIKAALALVSAKINKSKTTLDKGLQEVDHVDILLKRKNG